jgi:acetate kinase
MLKQTVQRILTVNTGSSSLKVALYELGRGETSLVPASSCTCWPNGG